MDRSHTPIIIDCTNVEIIPEGESVSKRFAEWISERLDLCKSRLEEADVKTKVLYIENCYFNIG